MKSKKRFRRSVLKESFLIALIQLVSWWDPDRTTDRSIIDSDNGAEEASS
ncbi:MAG: hypothetical protein WCF60_13440 [Anaerobacillus sp.]